MAIETIPEFNDRAGIEAFLRTKDKSWSVVLASRIALRVLPLIDLQDLHGKLKSSASHKFIQPLNFAISAASLVSAKVSYSREIDLRAVTIAAFFANAHPLATNAAAYVTNATNAAYAANATIAAAYAAEAAFNGRVFGGLINGLLRLGFYTAFRYDIQFLFNSNLSPEPASEKLAAQKLWLSPQPLENIKAWEAFKYHIPPNEGWDYWLDWYQDVLDGKPRDLDFELEVAKLERINEEGEPAKLNAKIKQMKKEWDAKKRPIEKNQYDFFLSYSTKNQDEALEIATIIKELGYSVFAQINDIRVGHSFVNEMNRGLAKSRRLIALLSPDYIQSEPCNSEWDTFFYKDPSGEKQLLLPFLIKETSFETKPLMQQRVYIPLLKLSLIEKKAKIKQILEALPKVEAFDSRLSTIEKIPEVIKYSLQGTTISASLALPISQLLPQSHTPKTKEMRKQAFFHLLQKIITDIKARKYNINSDKYIEQIHSAEQFLPNAQNEGNLILTENAMNMLAHYVNPDADENFRLKAQALLASYYGYSMLEDDLVQYRNDLRAAKPTEIPPWLAFETFMNVVIENSPTVFESNVVETTNIINATPVQLQNEPHEQPHYDTSQHPLRDINPENIQGYNLGSAFNSLVKVFKEGEKVNKNVEGWQGVGDKLQAPWQVIKAWLDSF